MTQTFVGSNSCVCFLHYLFHRLKSFEKISNLSRMWHAHSAEYLKHVTRNMYSTNFTVPGNAHTLFSLAVHDNLYLQWNEFIHVSSLQSLRCHVHYMFQASRSRQFMQETKQNTHIRTLKPEAIHSLINQLCLCLIICVYMYLYVYHNIL
jgi:hypothetical protein